MKKKIFEEPISEYEMLIDNQQDQQEYQEPLQRQQPRRQVSQAVEEYIEETGYEDEEVAYDLEDDQQDIVNEAMVRLEQAELYKMLIKHDLFEGVDGNPIAKQNVQNELKEYIVERLQVLLGIKAEKSARNTSMRVELPFNRMEIDALKDLAHKLTKGASSEIQEKEVVEAIEEEEEEPAPKPIRQPQKLQGLKPLSRNASGKSLPTKQVTQPTKQVVQQPVRQAQRPTNPPKQSNVVVNKTKRKSVVPEYKGGPIIDPSSGQVVTAEEIEIARQQLEDDLNRSQGKNPYEMSEDELRARNSQIKTQAVSKKVARLPMPSPDQVHLHLQSQSQSRIDAQSEQDSHLPNILSRVLANQ